MMQPIKILFTGRYQPDYNRNLIMLAGLKNLGVQVIEFPYIKKDRATKKALKSYDQEVDFIFLPSFTHMDVAFVKRHTTKLLIFDPLISKYMTKVFDYKELYHYSIRSLKNYLKDYIMMKKADVVIADTQQHMDYYSKVIRVDPGKISIIPVGVNIHQFYPERGAQERQKFKVGFYGSYIPLHGIEKIVEAARLLEEEPDIAFELVGNGFTHKDILKQLRQRPAKNIQLTDNIAYERLNEKINSFDLCLGIFGDGIKANMVVPNKVYHYAACGKCIITRDTPAIREVFTEHTNIVLCNGTAEDLAAKILWVWENPSVRETIAQNALSLMQTTYNQDRVAQKLIDVYQQKSAVTDRKRQKI